MEWLKILRRNSQALYPQIDFGGMSFDEIIAARGAALRPEPDDPTIDDLMAWLKNCGPDEWYRVAVTFNWDAGLELLRWIVSQSDCDKGTAVAVFHRASPAISISLRRWMN